MKRFLFVSILSLAMILFISSSYAQLRKIPAQVTDALSTKYPEAKSVEWKDKLSAFAANFEMEGIKYEAKFSNKGEWQSTEKELAEDNLPSPVQDGLSKSKYADWKIKATYEVYLPGDITQYHIVAKSDLQKKKLLFNDEGQLLKDNITL